MSSVAVLQMPVVIKLLELLSATLDDNEDEDSSVFSLEELEGSWEDELSSVFSLEELEGSWEDELSFTF